MSNVYNTRSSNVTLNVATRLNSGAPLSQLKLNSQATQSNQPKSNISQTKLTLNEQIEKLYKETASNVISDSDINPFQHEILHVQQIIMQQLDSQFIQMPSNWENPELLTKKDIAAE